MPVLLSANGTNGAVTFSEPVTAIAGVDPQFGDNDIGEQAFWIAAPTPTTVLFDSRYTEWNPGDTYVSLGGSTLVSPPPSGVVLVDITF